MAEANTRALTGASVIALIREQLLLVNPKSSTMFFAADVVGLIGEDDQVTAATRILAPL